MPHRRDIARWLRNRAPGLHRAVDEAYLRFAPGRTDWDARPVVTVAVVSRDDGSAMDTTLESLLAQRYRALECLVVDDASTDETAGRAARIAKTDPRVKLVVQPERGGLARARARALREAQGQYFIALRAGDRLDANAVWRGVRAIETLAVRTGGCYWRPADALGPVDAALDFLDGEDTLDLLWRPMLITGAARDVGGYHEGFGDAGDEDELHQRLLRAGLRFPPADSSPPEGARPLRDDRFLQRRRVLRERARLRVTPEDTARALPPLFTEGRAYYLQQRDALREALPAAAQAHARGDPVQTERILASLPACGGYLDHLVDVKALTIPHDVTGTEAGTGARANGVGGPLEDRVRDVCARRETPRLTGDDRPDVLFMPHNGYHTYEMSMVAQELNRRGYRTLFCDITDAYREEGVRANLRSLDLEHVAYTPDVLRRHRPGVLFVMNDWGGCVAEKVVEARTLGVRSVALVEGVQDYEDTHVEHIGVGRIRHPYKHADVALLVGAFDRRFFDGCETELTGSTRIEKLVHEPRPTDRARRIVINSNFTYGLYTSIQPEWIASAVNACRRVGVECVVSQHHADLMDLSGYPTTDRPLYDELRECSLVVSKFSGVILEAMALDTPCVYHNPHGERVAKFQDPMGAFPYTRDEDGLADAIREVLDTPIETVTQRAQPFFEQHVSVVRGRTAYERIADSVETQLARVALA